MKTETKKVRTGGQVVEEIEVPIYENVDEIIAKEDSARIVSMFNNANVVRIMGNTRAKYTLGAKVGKKRRFEIGFNLLWDVVGEETAQSVIGNIEKLKELIASDEVQSAIDDYIATQQESGAAEEEE